MIQRMLTIWSLVPLPLSKFSLNICRFTVHVLLKPGLENFEHYVARVWNECNWAVIWAFFVITFLWDWNENWPFPVLWPLLSFPHLLAYWVQHFHSIIFQDLKKLNWNSITSTSFVQMGISFLFSFAFSFITVITPTIVWEQDLGSSSHLIDV